MTKSRNYDLDILKGIAILAVVFYHIGILPFGYLGVDVFLVINGYFITHSMLYQFNNHVFSYSKYLKKRLLRLWPLVIIASFVSLAIGYFVMLPDDYENLSQSVVASNIFSNNILSAITTNYWDVSTSYKPLMHMWYVGILVQCYIVFPLIVWIVFKCGKKYGKSIVILITAVFIALYLMPMFRATHKFYFLPFRLFEFLIGSVIAVYVSDIKYIQKLRPLYAIATLLISLLCVLNLHFIPKPYKLLTTSILTGACILFSLYTQQDKEHTRNRFYLLIAWIGTMSYSIFVWHQIAIAFYKYSFKSSLQAYDYFILGIVIFFVSICSYYFLEKPIDNHSKINTKKAMSLTLFGCFLMLSTGLWVYLNAGVVRDIPELGVYKNNIKRGMHGAYCDRIYAYERPFADNGQLKVLGIGNSFIRDWLNILLESSYKDSLDITYLYIGHISTDNADKIVSKIDSADIVFMNGNIVGLPKPVLLALQNNNRAFFVGTKSFGESNGIFYRKRHSEYYFNSRAYIIPSVQEEYEEEQKYWGDHYIDMIKPLVDEKGTMPVFTNDKMYISQDCRHLTQAGAKYYAHILELSKFFHSNSD